MNGDEPSFSYTAVVRTLGTAGQMYQALLDSLCAQSIQPERILVYIAEGYPLPKETCGREEYIYCKKGMVAQRALPFDEVATEWILFCDDDIRLERDAVARLWDGLRQYPGSLCIAPRTSSASRMARIAGALLECTFPHHKKGWGTIIRKSMCHSYNSRPQGVLPTQSATGTCCLVKKQAYLRLNFASEAFLDDFRYALGEDTLFFYKLYKMGARPLVHYGGGVQHLSAATSHAESRALHKELCTASRLVVWHRASYSCAKGFLPKLWSAACYWGTAVFRIPGHILLSVAKRDISIIAAYLRGLARGARYIKTEKYKSLPPYFDEERDRI